MDAFGHICNVINRGRETWLGVYVNMLGSYTRTKPLRNNKKLSG